MQTRKGYKALRWVDLYLPPTNKNCIPCFKVQPQAEHILDLFLSGVELEQLPGMLAIHTHLYV